METNVIHEEVKRLKKEFFAYRNGIVADMLRDAGDCHKVIFGLNIPQLIGIANETGKNADVARKLWQNADCRESRLLAPMIFPAQTMTVDEAHQWMEDVENVEIADNLCHKLLKHLPFAETLIAECATSKNDLVRYAAFRLAMNLLCTNALTGHSALAALAKQEMERDCSLTRALCMEIGNDIGQTN